MIRCFVDVVNQDAVDEKISYSENYKEFYILSPQYCINNLSSSIYFNTISVLVHGGAILCIAIYKIRCTALYRVYT